jgi:hypothetical protein
VQATCAALFQQDAAGETGRSRYTKASRRFYDSIERTATMALLALGELEGKLQGRDFDIHDLQKLDWYEPELRKLEEAGVVEAEGVSSWEDSSDNFVLSGGRRWRVSAGRVLVVGHVGSTAQDEGPPTFREMD